eukprot:11782258-Alexandrium_andersonii.AAC.1
MGIAHALHRPAQEKEARRGPLQRNRREPTPAVGHEYGDGEPPWTPWGMGTWQYPLALGLAEDLFSQVQPLSQAWRERTNEVIAKVEGAQPLSAANKRGRCRYCG